MANESNDHHANLGGHDHSSHMDHAHHGGNINAMAVSATLHCLTGCAIG